MEIKPTSTNIHAAIARSISSTSQNSLPNTTTPPDWKVSQLIQAVITKITENQLFLNIQGTKANTAKPSISDLQVGDILKLQIEQLKPMPQFRIVSLQKSADTNLISQALNNLVSQKATITPLLKNISYVANRPALRPSPLAAEVNQAVRDIFKHLPSPFNVKSGVQIKEQLINSGTFIENKIRNQIFSSLQVNTRNKPENIRAQVDTNLRASLELDLGAQLHRLANLIRTQAPIKNSTPLNQNILNPASIPTGSKEVQQQAHVARTQVHAEQASLQNITVREEAMQSFLRQIESSLTHMQQTQLQNLNESQPGRPLWLMELPIKDGQDIDLFELRISEEETSQADNEVKKSWNVTLKFDLEGLGKVKAHIKMQNDFVSAQFFSEQKETLSLFQENFDFLRGRLNYNGLNVGNIECAHANLSQDIAPANSKRLDERT